MVGVAGGRVLARPRRAERCAFSYTAVEPSALVAGVRRLNRKHCKVASCHCSNRTITSPPPAHAPLPIQSVCNAAQPRPAPSLSGRPRTSHRREGRSSASTSSGAAAFPPSPRPISASAAAAEPPGYRTSGGRPSTWPPPRRRRLGWTWRRQIWMVSLADLIPLDVLFTAWLAVYKGSSIMLHWPVNQPCITLSLCVALPKVAPLPECASVILSVNFSH